MSKEDGHNTFHPKLPEEVRSIIIRKLRLLKKEQERRWVDVWVDIAKMTEEIRADLRARGIPFTTTNMTPNSVYREIVRNARVVTREWPGNVWDVIVSTLKNLQVQDVDSQNLNAIVDEYAWGVNKLPFTLAYIDPKRFHESVQRTVGRYGLKTKDSLDKGLLSDAAAGESSIRTIARHERERVGIAIAEYMIALRQGASSAVSGRSKPIYVRREAGKLVTESRYDKWKKAYRDLQKKHPGITIIGSARKIAKMDIGHGRSADTIRKKILE